MPDTVQTFFDSLAKIATELEKPHLLELIQAAQTQFQTPRLKILVAGTAGSGRFSLVNLLAGKPDFLPVSPIPKGPLRFTVGYDDRERVELLTRLGTVEPANLNRLKAFLTAPLSETAPYKAVVVGTSAPALSSLELQIEDIEAGQSQAEWKEILASTDFVIVLLKAPALLSEQERRFIREILQPDFGLERVALVINQVDRVAEAELPSLSERVRTFLGSFESRPLLFELSAARTLKNWRAGTAETEPALDPGYRSLNGLVQEVLVKKYSVLKLAAFRQVAENCLAELEEEITRRRQLLSAGSAEFSTLRSRLDTRQQELNNRVKRAQERLELYVNTLLKEQFLREIEGFAQALAADLPAEIRSIPDISVIRKNLPGYLEALWNEFFEKRSTNLKIQLTAEVKKLGETVRADLKQLLGDQAGQLDWLDDLDSFNPSPGPGPAFVAPRRAKSNQDTLATGLQIGGLVLLITNLPLGLAAIGGGQLLRTVFKKDMTAADQQASIEAAQKAIYEQEQQLKAQVGKIFEELTARLRQGVEKLYSGAFEEAKTRLEEGERLRGDLKPQEERLDRYQKETLPELRERLNRLTSKEEPK